MQNSPVAFITGASSGIGRATAIHLARAGYRTAGTGRNQASLDETRAAVAGEFLPLIADVRNPESVVRAVAETIDAYGQLDVLVANAGVGHKGAIVEADWPDVETLLRTNIDGVLHSIRAAVPHMNDGGHIVTLSSVTYNMTAPNAAYYAASKAFVSSIARSLRMELEDRHIGVTDMIVGRTATNFNANRLGGERPGDNIHNMTPDDVAAAIVEAIQKRRNSVTLRPIDRLIVLGNILIPNVIGRIVQRRYR